MKLTFIVAILIEINANVFQSCQKSGDIALTYDGGPSPYTGSLLNILSEKEIKAAFHFTGEYFDTPYIAAYAKQAVQDGHLIGVMCKEDLVNVKLDNSSFFDGITDLQSQIERATGVKPSFLRIPYISGPYPKDIVEKLEEMGFTLTVQNLDPGDYRYAKSPNDKSSVFNEFRSQIDMIVAPSRGSFISTQHDFIPATVNQTPDIIDYLKQKDYNIVRLDQCINKPAPSSGSGGLGKSGSSKSGNNLGSSKQAKAADARMVASTLLWTLLSLALAFLF